ncbi:hypothetical protein lbkm_1098 [Lachnospiraceae bacterium KM106-2]|nr:hypothetical protein lbkm_1098 [Lachnospiraceae bacterium KM106-2]
MRLKITGNNTNEVKKALDFILTEYNLELSSTNLYLNFAKDEQHYEFYNLNTMETSFITTKKANLLKKKLEDTICLSYNNYYFYSSMMACLNGWEATSKNIIKAYLLSELGVKPMNNREQLEDLLDIPIDGINKVIAAFIEETDIHPDQEDFISITSNSISLNEDA